MTETKHLLKVFLSYASQDKPLVRELSRRLVGEGWIDTWQDEKNLLPGQDWRVKIEEAVEAADVVIICLSNHSVSKEGHVQKELRYAREIALEKPEDAIFLIPLRLDECEVPRGLRFYQWVDYFGENKDVSYKALVASLKLRYEQKIKLEELDSARKEKRDAEQRAAREEALQEIAIKAQLEDEVRARKKFEKEEADRKAAEKIAREKLQREIDKRAKDIQLKLKQEIFFSRLRSKLSLFFLYFRYYVLPAILLLGVAVGGFYLGKPFFDKAMSPAQDIAVTQTSTSHPNVTKTPVPSKISAPVSTPTKIVAPTPTPTPLPTEITDAKGVSMALVSAGEFTMGRDIAENKEMPAHKVYLDAFYMDIYEVTYARYKVCMDAGVCPTTYIPSGHPDFPVNTNWFESKAYCEFRGARLPTEAEWEKAARGTDDRTYPWGESIDCSFANYWQCKGSATKVGSYEKGKSPYGIYDLAGNLGEWVADWFSESYYQNSPFSNPLGPQTGQQKVRRGGSWYFSEDSLRVSSRFGQDPSVSVDAFGFRCARSVP